jgi:hypothetical protein
MKSSFSERLTELLTERDRLEDELDYVEKEIEDLEAKEERQIREEGGTSPGD